MKFSIDGRVYDADRVVEDVTLRQWLTFEKETADLGRRMTQADVVRMSARIAELPEDEQTDDPDMIWLTAVTVWAARVGEGLTFGEAVDIPMSRLVAIPEPEDRKQKEPGNPRTARPGSGRAAHAVPHVVSTLSSSSSAATSAPVSGDA